MMADMAYTILVADDEPAIRTMLEVILTAEGHQVVAVPNGQAALDYLHSATHASDSATHASESAAQGAAQSAARATPDALLLDVNMPGVSGFDLCAQVRQNPAWRALPVLLLTGADDQATRDRAALVQADELLLKPVPGRVLRETVARRLEHGRTLPGGSQSGGQA